MAKRTGFGIRNAIGRSALVFGLLLCPCALQPAHAGDGRCTALLVGGKTLEPVAVICVNPVSGEEARIGLEKGQDEVCPADHTQFIVFEVELTPGADPLPFKQQEQEPAEVGDAPMGRQ